MARDTTKPEAPPLPSPRTPQSSSGAALKPFYRPEDAPDYDAALGDPGAYPFTRGLYRDGYRQRRWTMRQYAGYASASESNRRYRYLLSQGTTGLSVAFDLPTQIGYDSDHALARGEVGRVGVAIDSIADMRRLFDGIPLDRVTTSMTINATAAILLALYLAVAEEQGVGWDRVGGTVQNDILKEYAARGTYIFPPGPSLKLTGDVIAFCAERVPKWNPISISGYHMREAGSTAAQEVAFTLANALAYVDAVLGRGLPIDEFAPRLSFFFNAHNNFLEEVAKFRAARKLWAELLGERFGITDREALKLRFHTQTAGSTLTALQPLSNVVRVTVQALAAVLGGTQSLHTNGYDEALALPSEQSATLALRTQQVIGYESGVDKVIDPLGGSWYVESLTDRIEAGARELIAEVDALGGAARAIERGFFQEAIARSAYAIQKAQESGELVVVGVNRFTDESAPPTIATPDFSALEAQQKARVAEARRRRDGAAVSAALAALRTAASGTAPLMPPILAAVRARATLGEISDALREVWGVYRAA